MKEVNCHPFSLGWREITVKGERDQLATRKSEKSQRNQRVLRRECSPKLLGILIWRQTNVHWFWQQATHRGHYQKQFQWRQMGVKSDVKEVNTEGKGRNTVWWSWWERFFPTGSHFFEHFISRCWCCLDKVMGSEVGATLLEEVWGLILSVYTFLLLFSFSVFCIWMKMWPTASWSCHILLSVKPFSLWRTLSL